MLSMRLFSHAGFRAVLSTLMSFDFLLFGAILALKADYLNVVFGLQAGNRFGGVASFLLLHLVVTTVLKAVLQDRFRQFALLATPFIALILHVDLLYFRYFSGLPSVQMLFQTTGAWAVVKSIPWLVKPEDLIFYFDLPLWWFLARHKVNAYTLKRALGAVLLAAVLLVVYVPRNPHMANVLGMVFVHDRFHPVYLKQIGIVGYHFQDLYWEMAKAMQPNPPLSETDRELLDHVFLPGQMETRPLVGKYAGKNLIVIQAESLQEFVLNRSVEGQPITPHLNALAQESLNFSNHYHQIGPGHTSDAEILTQQALFGLPDEIAYWALRDTAFYSLPEALTARGYSTLSMHGNNGLFFNRLQMHKRLGFAKSLFLEDLRRDDLLGMGLSDKSFFKQAVERLKELPKPFYGFMITLSSHHPFTDNFPNEVPLKLGALEDTSVGRYLTAVHYLDEAIGELVADLKAEGLWDETVVVVYGDHNGMIWDDRQDLAEFLGIEMTPISWAKLQRVPLIVHLPDGVAKRIDKTAGQIDLAPTIASLLGVDVPASWRLGHDLLTDAEQQVTFRDGGWIKGSHFYVRSADMLQPMYFNDDAAWSPEQVDEELRLAGERLRASDLVLKHDQVRHYSETYQESSR
ncbi:Lipoteichoic acid synthase 2 [compost metagenome]